MEEHELDKQQFGREKTSVPIEAGMQRRPFRAFLEVGGWISAIALCISGSIGWLVIELNNERDAVTRVHEQGGRIHFRTRSAGVAGWLNSGSMRNLLGHDPLQDV